MIMAVKEDCGKIGGPQECAGCGKKIHDKYLLKVNHALNIYYISIKKENKEKIDFFKFTKPLLIMEIRSC